MAKLEELEEVDLSGNVLKTVPTTIMNCRRMHTLIAHSNSIEAFPEVMQLMEMKVRARRQRQRQQHMRVPLAVLTSCIGPRELTPAPLLSVCRSELQRTERDHPA